MLDASVSVPPASGNVGGSPAAAPDTGVPHLLAPPHAQAAEGASAPASDVNQSFEAVPIDLEGSAQPDVQDSKPEQAEPARKGLQPAQASSSGSALPKRSPSLLFAMAHAKSATEHLQQAPAQPPSDSPKPVNLLSHSSSAARPIPPFQAPKLSLPTPASSTRIAMPRSLTSLASLKSADSLPRAEPVSSPAAAPEPAASSSTAAELAASEGQLQATAQQFQDLLQNTLQRTKEGVHRVREFVLKVAGGQNGKVAARRLIIMVLDYIETAQMHKRIDLFYLMDSLLQVLIVSHFLFWLIPVCRLIDIKEARAFMIRLCSAEHLSS